MLQRIITTAPAGFLLHGNTNDEDVNVIEQKAFIDALKAAGKKFEYKIYQDAPGGHQFNRLDTRFARESRAEAAPYRGFHEPSGLCWDRSHWTAPTIREPSTPVNGSASVRNSMP